MTQDLLDDVSSSAPLGRLTRRESVVLSQLQQGLTLDEIAARLYVSRNTVKTQVRSLYRKLGVSSRAEAVGPLGRRHVGERESWHLPPASRHVCGGVLPTEPGVADARPRPPDSASIAAPPACLACLAHRREAARVALDAIDDAIASEVSATRSGGANWTEIAAALGMTRQAARRRFDDHAGVVAAQAERAGGRW